MSDTLSVTCGHGIYFILSYPVHIFCFFLVVICFIFFLLRLNAIIKDSFRIMKKKKQDCYHHLLLVRNIMIGVTRVVLTCFCFCPSSDLLAIVWLSRVANVLQSTFIRLWAQITKEIFIEMLLCYVFFFE